MMEAMYEGGRQRGGGGGERETERESMHSIIGLWFYVSIYIIIAMELWIISVVCIPMILLVL